MKLIEHQNVLCLYDVYENRKYLVSKDWIYNAKKKLRKKLFNKNIQVTIRCILTKYFHKNIQRTIQNISTKIFKWQYKVLQHNISTKIFNGQYKIFQQKFSMTIQSNNTIFPQKYPMDNTTYFNKNIQVTLRSITTQYKILQPKHPSEILQQNISTKIFTWQYKIFQYFSKDIQVTTQNISVPGAWTRVWGRALRLPREERTTHTQSKIWWWW